METGVEPKEQSRTHNHYVSNRTHTCPHQTLRVYVRRDAVHMLENPVILVAELRRSLDTLIFFLSKKTLAKKSTFLIIHKCPRCQY